MNIQIETNHKTSEIRISGCILDHHKKIIDGILDLLHAEKILGFNEYSLVIKVAPKSSFRVRNGVYATNETTEKIQIQYPYENWYEIYKRFEAELS